MKIQNKLTWVIFIFGALVLICLSVSYYYKSRSAIMKESMDSALETANQASHYLEQLLKEKAKTAIAISNAPVLSEALVKSNAEFFSLTETKRKEKISAQNKRWMESKDITDPFIKARMHNTVADFFHNQIRSISGEFGEIFLTNRYGVMIGTTKKLTTLAHSHKYWWLASFYEGVGRIFFDDRGFDESVGGYALGIVVPVMQDNQVIGILKCNINILGAMSQVLDELKGSIIGKLKLLRTGGDIIYEEGVTPLSTRAYKTVIDEMKKGADGSTLHIDNSKEVLSSFAPVHLTKGSPQYGFGGSYKSTDHIQGNKGEGWYVLVQRNVKDVLLPLVSITGWIASVGMLFTFLMAMVALYLGRKISSPIVHVASIVEKVGKRDFSVRVNINSKDELESLGASINKMVSDLQRTTASIDDLNKEITERKRAEEGLKRSEERLRTIFEQAPLGIALIDSITGHVYEVNLKFAQIAGRTREEMATVDWMSITHPDDVEEDLDNMALLNAGKINGFNMNKRYVHLDGSEVWINMTIAPVKVADKAHPRHLCMIQNISEQKRAEENMRQSQKMKALGTLAGGIAHDFNNILGGILGYTELSRDNMPQNSPVADYLNKVLKLTGRAENLVSQILAFSRKEVDEKNPLDIVPVLKETLKLLYSTLPKTIEIEKNIDESSAAIVIGNPSSIHQIMMNLITNAAQSMKEDKGIIKITLTSERLDEKDLSGNSNATPGIFVKLSVQDNGSGIDPSVINNIFDPFFTTKDVGKGTGLGLSVVHGIVTAHGGLIKVNSVPNEGTTFNVFLPKSEMKTIETASVSPQAIPGTGNILFVDDEEVLTNIAQRRLPSLGYTVTVANSCSEAIKIFKEAPEQFDLVITDLSMPKMTGVDLSKRLLELRPEIPVILCSGNKGNVTDQSIKDAGIRAVVMKPISKAEISKVIFDILNPNKE